MSLDIRIQHPDRPHLNTLFVTYFDDGASRYDSVWHAADAFREEFSPAYVARARQELLDLVEAAKTEAELAAAADVLHCEYDPRAIGMTYETFFRRLLRVLEP